MKTMLLGMVLLAGCAGCAAPMDSEQIALARALNSCGRLTRSAAESYGPLFPTASILRYQQQFFERCMNSRGYREAGRD